MYHNPLSHNILSTIEADVKNNQKLRISVSFVP